MRARHILAVGTAAFALAGSVLAASPASAATTPVTFTLTNTGLLSLTAPSTEVTLGTVTGTLGGTSSVSGSLGDSTVTDARGALANLATVNVTSTPFLAAGDTGGTATIPASAATASTGAASATTGTLTVFTPTAVPVGDLSGGQNIATLASVGSGSATYNPTISVALPINAVANAKYTGTITQTAS